MQNNYYPQQQQASVGVWNNQYGRPPQPPSGWQQYGVPPTPVMGAFPPGYAAPPYGGGMNQHMPAYGAFPPGYTQAAYPGVPPTTMYVHASGVPVAAAGLPQQIPPKKDEGLKPAANPIDAMFGNKNINDHPPRPRRPSGTQQTLIQPQTQEPKLAPSKRVTPNYDILREMESEVQSNSSVPASASSTSSPASPTGAPVPGPFFSQPTPYSSPNASTQIHSFSGSIPGRSSPFDASPVAVPFGNMAANSFTPSHTSFGAVGTMVPNPQAAIPTAAHAQPHPHVGGAPYGMHAFAGASIPVPGPPSQQPPSTGPSPSPSQQYQYYNMPSNAVPTSNPLPSPSLVSLAPRPVAVNPPTVAPSTPFPLQPSSSVPLAQLSHPHPTNPPQRGVDFNSSPLFPPQQPAIGEFASISQDEWDGVEFAKADVAEPEFSDFTDFQSAQNDQNAGIVFPQPQPQPQPITQVAQPHQPTQNIQGAPNFFEFEEETPKPITSPSVDVSQQSVFSPPKDATSDNANDMWGDSVAAEKKEISSQQETDNADTNVSISKSKNLIDSLMEQTLSKVMQKPQPMVSKPTANQPQTNVNNPRPSSPIKQAESQSQPHSQPKYRFDWSKQNYRDIFTSIDDQPEQSQSKNQNQDHEEEQFEEFVTHAQDVGNGPSDWANFQTTSTSASTPDDLVFGSFEAPPPLQGSASSSSPISPRDFFAATQGSPYPQQQPPYTPIQPQSQPQSDSRTFNSPRSSQPIDDFFASQAVATPTVPTIERTTSITTIPSAGAAESLFDVFSKQIVTPTPANTPATSPAASVISTAANPSSSPSLSLSPNISSNSQYDEMLTQPLNTFAFPSPQPPSASAVVPTLSDANILGALDAPSSNGGNHLISSDNNNNDSSVFFDSSNSPVLEQQSTNVFSESNEVAQPSSVADDDFGSFSSPATAIGNDDDFFGDFSSPNGSTSFDDDFTPFASSLPAPTTTMIAAATKTPLLSDILMSLIQQERLVEALACQRHIKDGTPVAQEMVTAWAAPNPSHTTITDLKKKLTHSGVPQEKIMSFFAQFDQQPLPSIAQKDLQIAVELQKQAEQYAQTLAMAHQCEIALSKCMEILETALRLASEVRIAADGHWDPSLVFANPKWVSYFKGVTEVYRVASRIVAAGKHYQCSSPLAPKVASIWNELKSIVKENITVDYTSSWSTPSSSAQPCLLCRVPVTPMHKDDPTLTWDGGLYHTSCANMWANCVAATPPPRG